MAAVFVLAAFALPSGASARANVDLLTDANVRIDGAAVDDAAAAPARPAGDVNGDGLKDVILGANRSSNNGAGAGSAYVIYGARATGSPVTVDLGNLDGRGFRIDGAAARDLAGFSVYGAGDVNGDGADDVIVGAPNAGSNGRTDSGSAYVVYGPGRRDLGNVDLRNALGNRGFRIDGAAPSDALGFSVAGAGDVNGDGVDDVVVGAFRAGNNGRTESGSAYVVYGPGASDQGTVDLRNSLGGRGFRIDGAVGSETSGASGADEAGFSVGGAGDANSDGVDDVIVGAPHAGNNGRSASGSAYVVYGPGQQDLGNVDLKNSLGSRGFRMDGGATGDQAGYRTAGAGDVNGDGADDVIVGAVTASNNGRRTSGSAYVVYGSGQNDRGNVDLKDSLGTRGFRIDGASVGDQVGVSLATAGDVNQDGLADVSVGSTGTDNNGRTDSGSAYVVYGPQQADPGNVDLSALGQRGFRIDGAATGDSAYSVSGVGDMDGDGVDDVIVGALGADNNGRANSGSAYLVDGAEVVAADDSTTLDEDAPATAVAVLANDNGKGTKQVASVSRAANGTALVTGGGTGVSYEPSANYCGPDSFTYKLTSGSTATVSVTVTCVNDAPVAGNDSASVDEDGTLTRTAAQGVLANDSDVEGDSLSATLSSGTAHGTLALNPDGSYTYSPNKDFNGTDSFTYRADDGKAKSDPATVTLTVTAVNDAPVAANDSGAVDEDGTLTKSATDGVLSNDSDVDGDGLTAALVTGPAHGTLTLNPNGSYTYKPGANYNGPDSFTYRASDGQATSDPATVSLTVNPVDDPPVAVDDSAAVDAGSAATSFDVLANDTDVDGGPKSVLSTSDATHGDVAVTGGGSGVSYTPDAGYCNTRRGGVPDSFAYKLNGGSEAQVSVTVTCGPSATTTSVSSSQNPSVEGGRVTFTATVVATASGADTPGGTVTFKDGSDTLGTAPLDGGGKAELATSDLGAGDHAISAVYGGGGDFQPSSGSLSGGQRVDAAAPAPSAPAAPPDDGNIQSVHPGLAIFTRATLSHRKVPRVGSYVKVVIRCRGAAGVHCRGRVALDPAAGSSRLRDAAARGRYGRARFDVATGANATVKVRVSSRFRRTLKAKRRLIALATATYTTGDQGQSTTRRKLTVVEPRRSRTRR